MDTNIIRLLLLAVVIVLLHTLTKLYLIAAVSKRPYFKQKLGHSYSFYSEKKIKKTLDRKVKSYYINSNWVNRVFYIAFFLTMVGIVTVS